MHFDAKFAAHSTLLPGAAESLASSPSAPSYAPGRNGLSHIVYLQT